jgi:hypothetical protein
MIIKIEKVGANIQPTVETTRSNRPPTRRNFGVNRRLKTLIMIAEITPIIEAAVMICPVTPTVYPKVSPMSSNRRPVKIPGGIVAKREITNDGRSIFPGFLIESVPILVKYSPTFLAFTISLY